MFRSFYHVARRHLSLDNAIIAAVTAGTALVIWDARQEGNQPLLGQFRANCGENLASRTNNPTTKSISFKPSQ